LNIIKSSISKLSINENKKTNHSSILNKEIKNNSNKTSDSFIEINKLKSNIIKEENNINLDDPQFKDIKVKKKKRNKVKPLEEVRDRLHKKGDLGK